MTSSPTPGLAEFAVFAYLSDTTSAVPAGLLEMAEHGPQVLRSRFRYGRRYAARPNRIALDSLTLALPGVGVEAFREPPVTLHGALTEFGVFRDAAPDRWGRRVIENKLRQTGPLPESVYLREAGANRTGALDFRVRPDSPEPVGGLARSVDLGYLQEAAERIEAGEPVPARLAAIFDAGPSMGGARPKAVVEHGERQWLAKFAQAGDAFCVPRVERATLLMARAAGLDVPQVEIVDVGAGRPAMLIERFDRYRLGGGYGRRHFVSALTLLARHESESSASTYPEIAEAIARHGAAGHVKSDQAELFGRMIFNILVSNTNDHLRNHGFVYDPQVEGWRLSKLYDVVPMPSHAGERFLHLGVGSQGRAATLPNAMSQHGVFGLTRPAALAIVDRVCSVVREWRVHFEQAGVPGEDIDRVATAFRHPREVGGDALKERVRG